MHTIIFIPGLSDTHPIRSVAPWKRQGLTPIFFASEWKSTENLGTKLSRLLSIVDAYSMKENHTSLIGCSAGASLALNAFAERKHAICSVVNVCGRLRKGTVRKWPRSFEARTVRYPSFRDSVIRFESKEPSLSQRDREKMLTIRSSIADEFVPPGTVTIPGAANITIPVPEHMLSIYASLVLFPGRVIRFLQQKIPA